MLKVGISGYTPVLTFTQFVKAKAREYGLEVVAECGEKSFFAFCGEAVSEFRIDFEYEAVLNGSITHRGLIVLFEMIEAYGRLISLLGVDRKVFVKTIWDK